MNKADFQFYQKLLLERSGLSLSQDKIYLLNTRLEPLVQKFGLSQLSGLTELLRKKHDPRVISAVVQAMTTNETLFFRDNKPFTYLKEHMFPALMKKNAATKIIHLWSAACSSGQEPYSMAIVARDFFRAYPDWRVQITATDIAEDCLAQAREGVYSQFEIQRGLTMKIMLENFTQEKTQWKVRDELKRMINFSYFNLLDPMTGMGNFDVIFCRNVLIYFDKEMKKSVLKRLAERMHPGGFLMLGSCESLIGLGTQLNLKQSDGIEGVYVPDGDAGRAKEGGRQ